VGNKGGGKATICKCPMGSKLPKRKGNVWALFRLRDPKSGSGESRAQDGWDLEISSNSPNSYAQPQGGVRTLSKNVEEGIGLNKKACEKSWSCHDGEGKQEKKPIALGGVDSAGLLLPVSLEAGVWGRLQERGVCALLGRA